jgi:hypothetical protein
MLAGCDNYHGSQHRQRQLISGASICCAGNFDQGSKLVATSTGFCGITWCLAESWDDFILFSFLKLGHDKLSTSS